MRNSVETITAFAKDMNDFLVETESTESEAFLRCFVKEMSAAPGTVTIHYRIPNPEDSPTPGKGTQLSTTRCIS